MQQGSRNRTPPARSKRENTDSESQTPVRSCEKNLDDTNVSSDMDHSSNVLNVSESNTANCFNASVDECIIPKRELVTDCNVLQRLAEVHSFCILGKYFLNCVVL